MNNHHIQHLAIALASSALACLLTMQVIQLNTDNDKTICTDKLIIKGALK